MTIFFNQHACELTAGRIIFFFNFIFAKDFFSFFLN